MAVSQLRGTLLSLHGTKEKTRRREPAGLVIRATTAADPPPRRARTAGRRRGPARSRWRHPRAIVALGCRDHLAVKNDAELWPK
jgi:hypothetical protein